jgi:large subunit ribosomal protein LP0
MPLSKTKKVEYFKKMNRILDTYEKVFVVDVTNVGSQQINSTRLAMRGKAEILMGKNTMMKKVLATYLETNPNHLWSDLGSRMSGNVGFVFTNAELPEIRDFILANRVPAPARVNSIAPVDVVVPPGPTGCDPGQTSFFQVLQIPTKIVKGQIEITNSVNLIKTGDKVGSSEAALLNKLNIKPFSYGLKICEIFDSGAFFGVEVLDIDDDYLQNRFSFVTRKLAALSFALNYPTSVSVAHSVANALKTMTAITLGLDTFTFDKADAFKAGGGGGGGGGGDAPAAAAAPVEAEKPKEEEIDFSGGMDMFGGDGGDY